MGRVTSIDPIVFVRFGVCDVTRKVDRYDFFHRDRYGNERGIFAIGSRGRPEPAMADGGNEPPGMRFERLAAVGGQREMRDRLSAAKFLVDGDQPPDLEPPGMRGKVAIGQLRGPAQVDELLPLVHRQRGENLKPAGIGNQRIERHTGLSDEDRFRLERFMRVREIEMKWRLDPGQIEVVDPAVAAVLRRKTITERIAMVLDANATMRLLIEGPLRARHPDWTTEQIQHEVARRMLHDAR